LFDYYGKTPLKTLWEKFEEKPIYVFEMYGYVIEKNP